MSPIGWSGWNRARPRRSGRPRCSRRTRSAPRAWERRDARDRPAERRAGGVGSMFQYADQQLFARTVRDDVSFGPRALGFAAPEVQQRVGRALAALGLEPHAAHPPYDLPPAFRKLAALAGALALEPRLLVLDEPTAGPDRALRAPAPRAPPQRAAAGPAPRAGPPRLPLPAPTLGARARSAPGGAARARTP